MSLRKILFSGVLVLAACLVVYDMLGRFSRITSPAGVFIPVLVIVGAWCLVGGWIGWNIVQMLGERVSRLYWPKQTVIPPPLYFLTEHYEKEGRISEALQEYEKILGYHPRELQAQIGRLRCGSLLGESPQKLWKNYNGYYRVLETDREKEILNREYQKLVNITIAAPEV